MKAGDKSAFVIVGEITNAPTTAPVGSLTIEGFDENNFLMDQGTFPNFGGWYNLMPSPFTNPSIVRSDDIISKIVTLTFNFTQFNSLPAGSKI